MKNSSQSQTHTLKRHKQKAEFLKGLKEAVNDVKLIKEGKLKGRPAKELINKF